MAESGVRIFIKNGPASLNKGFYYRDNHRCAIFDLFFLTPSPSHPKMNTISCLRFRVNYGGNYYIFQKNRVGYEVLTPRMLILAQKDLGPIVDLL